VPDYQSIISLEASGDQVERLPNTWDEQGRTLVMGKIPNTHVEYVLTLLASLCNGRLSGSHTEGCTRVPAPGRKAFGVRVSAQYRLTPTS
jgi:hypothetical protein